MESDIGISVGSREIEFFPDRGTQRFPIWL